MSEVQIKISRDEELVRFLSLNDFDVEDLGNNLYRVVRGDELPVYISIRDNQVYCEVDLGNISAIANEDLYFRLLDLNTEILPVSFGVDNTNPEDPRLVLVESRDTRNLNDHELLGVFDALELAVDRAEELLTPVLEG